MRAFRINQQMHSSDHIFADNCRNKWDVEIEFDHVGSSA
jgi:hypothetical protein